MPLALLSCVRDRVFFLFWQGRVIFLIPGLDFVMVGWIEFKGIIILCIWPMDPFDERLFYSSDFLVLLICFQRAGLHSMIRWVGTVAGWMLVTGGSFVCHS